jgi:hypothetical protein
MTYVVAFDPGEITGYASGYFYPYVPLEITTFAALDAEQIGPTIRRLAGTKDNDRYVVSERFDARSNKFVANVHAKKVEGLLEGAFSNVVWRKATKKEQVPDSVLKEHGLWKTGKDVDWEDGRDVNDAIIHLIGFVAFDLHHRPTLEKYFKPARGGK